MQQAAPVVKQEAQLNNSGEKRFSDGYLKERLGLFSLAGSTPLRGRNISNLVRKPVAGESHTRFDERDLETEPQGTRQISTLPRTGASRVGFRHARLRRH